MKKILNILGVFILGASIPAPLVKMFDSNNQQQPSSDETFSITFKKDLENYRILPQEGDQYCVPAAVESVLMWVNGRSPSQIDLAHYMGTTCGIGTNFESIIDIFRNYISNYIYDSVSIPRTRDFGETQADMALFQNAVIYSLQLNMPLLIGTDGRIPWLNSNGNHVVPIIGIEADENPALTRYQVAEANFGENGTAWFTGSDLSLMFSNLAGAGRLALPNARRFNFSQNTVEVPINNQTGRINREVSNEMDLDVSEHVNILAEAGIYSMFSLKIATAIVLSDFSYNFQWNGHASYRSVEYWDISKIVAERGWEISKQDSVLWDDDVEGEAFVNLSYNQTLTPEMDLAIYYKVGGNKIGPRKMPYVDFNMGKKWVIKY